MIFTLAVNDTLADRLWPHVAERLSGCVEYTRADNGWGYGSIRARRSDGTWGMLRTHCAAWLLTHGDVPDGVWVLHRCDNPRCCNPEHLFLGTSAENTADKCRKGRQPFGMQMRQTKLADEDVEYIRREYASGAVSQRELGRRIGVTQSTISRVVAHKTRR